MKKLRVHPPPDAFVLGGRLDTAPANPTVLCCTVNAARIAADTALLKNMINNLFTALVEASLSEEVFKAP